MSLRLPLHLSKMTNYDVFHQWLEHCPVPFEFLSEDESDGQTAYIFHINAVID